MEAKTKDLWVFIETNEDASRAESSLQSLSATT